MNPKRTFTLIVALAGSLMVSGCGPSPAIATAWPPAATASETTTPVTTVTPPAPTVGPGGFPRRFHVEGTAFVDQFGQQQVFRGTVIQVPGYAIHPDWFENLGQHEVDLNERYFDALAAWKPGIILINIYPNDPHTYGWTDILRVLDQEIEWAAERQIYVVLRNSGIGWFPDNNFDENSRTDLQDYLTFWDILSKRYAGNDAVAFYDVFGEPSRSGSANRGSDADWQVWKGIAEQAIAAIRQNDPEKIIIVPGLSNSYDVSFAQRNPILGANIAYATHPYMGRAGGFGVDWDTAFGIPSETLPVFAVEFGCGTKAYDRQIIEYFEQRHISWIAWGGFYVEGYCTFLVDKKFTPNEIGMDIRNWLQYFGEGSPRPQPGDFAKAGPANGAANALVNQALSWTDSIEADSYDYCIDTVNDNACNTSWVSVGANERVILSDLNVGSAYYWQVRALNANGTTYADDGVWNSFTASSQRNLALGQSVQASSMEGSGEEPNKVVDGDYSTRWASAWSDPQWIQVDLGRVYEINRVMLHWETAYAITYEIQVSIDGINWTTIYSTDSGIGGTEDLSVTGRGRYVRMYGIQRRVYPGGAQYGYSLFEFEVYGPASQASGPVPFQDNFDEALGEGWRWINENRSAWSLTDVPGWLQIIAGRGGMDDSTVENLLLRPAPSGNFELDTGLRFNPIGNFQSAGLVIYESPSHYLKLSRSYCAVGIGACVGDGIYFDLVANGTQIGSNFAAHAPASGLVYLRLRREGIVFTAYLSGDGAQWIKVGEHQDDIVPGSIGLIAGGTLSTDPVPAQFDYFTASGLP